MAEAPITTILGPTTLGAGARMSRRAKACSKIQSDNKNMRESGMLVLNMVVAG